MSTQGWRRRLVKATAAAALVGGTVLVPTNAFATTQTSGLNAPLASAGGYRQQADRVYPCTHDSDGWWYHRDGQRYSCYQGRDGQWWYDDSGRRGPGHCPGCPGGPRYGGTVFSKSMDHGPGR